MSPNLLPGFLCSLHSTSPTSLSLSSSSCLPSPLHTHNKANCLPTKQQVKTRGVRVSLSVRRNNGETALLTRAFSQSLLLLCLDFLLRMHYIQMYIQERIWRKRFLRLVSRYFLQTWWAGGDSLPLSVTTTTFNYFLSVQQRPHNFHFDVEPTMGRVLWEKCAITFFISWTCVRI